MKTKKMVLLFAIILISFLLSGCATVPRRNPLPEKFSEIAQIPKIPLAKFWGLNPPRLPKQFMNNHAKS